MPSASARTAVRSFVVVMGGVPCRPAQRRDGGCGLATGDRPGRPAGKHDGARAPRSYENSNGLRMSFEIPPIPWSLIAMGGIYGITIAFDVTRYRKSWRFDRCPLSCRLLPLYPPAPDVISASAYSLQLTRSRHRLTASIPAATISTIPVTVIASGTSAKNKNPQSAANAR